MPATRQTTATSDRLSQAILERQAGIFDVMRSVTDRNHRFTRSLIESARQGNRDLLEVGRRWAKRPTDVTGIYDAIADAVGNSQQRTIALSRECSRTSSRRSGRTVNWRQRTITCVAYCEGEENTSVPVFKRYLATSRLRRRPSTRMSAPSTCSRRSWRLTRLQGRISRIDAWQALR